MPEQTISHDNFSLFLNLSNAVNSEHSIQYVLGVY